MSKYDKLNEQQKDAVFTVDGPMLILAGAGSGKTSVITNRIAYLIEEAGVEPYNILAITFTNKAAGEMRERVDKLVGFGAEQIFVSTFHSMCVRMLRRYIDRIGYDNHFTIYDTDDQKQVISQVCKKLELDPKKYRANSLINKISSFKNELITCDELALTCMGDYAKQVIAKIYREYQATLEKSNALDFDDLLMKTVELFKAEPDVLKNYQNRFRYIMVDEYQDTNTAQFELVRLLAGSLHNICVVGDDDQSIYRFRGANIRNILDFEKHFPEAKVVKLEQNYRSVQNILDAANAVIRNNSARKEKSLWSKKPEGERIHFRQLDSAYDEADYVVRNIKENLENGKFSLHDNAILYRKNALSRLFEERLIKASIPYVIVGGIDFYSRREIKDLLAYLKTINNAADDLACRRIINVPKRGIGATSVTKLQSVADERGVTFFDVVCHPEWADIKGPTADKLKSFANMIFRFRAVNEEFGPKKCLTEVLDITDYISQMDCDTDEEEVERVQNIEELISKVALFEEENENATLADVLEDIALVADIDTADTDSDHVLLTTIHSAKGLEFTNVYLVGMEDGIFPGYAAILSDDSAVEIEEERRLAYVAITRAKESLTITCSKCRKVNGETQMNQLSRFVKEIPRNLFDIAPVERRNTYDTGYYDSDTSSSGGYRRFDNYRDDEITSSTYGSGFSGFKRTPDAPLVSPVEKYARPKAYYTPKTTPEEDKPFVAKKENLNLLTKGSQLSTSSSGSSSYVVGDRVKHIKFGEGTVLNMVKEPRDTKVTVQFDAYGQKVLYAAFAKLEKI